jgi:hypothetical protein
MRGEFVGTREKSGMYADLAKHGYTWLRITASYSVQSALKFLF